MGHDHLQLHQEERQNYAQRRHNARMGLHSGSAERNLDPRQRHGAALARVFRTMEGIIQHNPELEREAEVQANNIYLANGTIIDGYQWRLPGRRGL